MASSFEELTDSRCPPPDIMLNLNLFETIGSNNINPKKLFKLLSAYRFF